MSFSGSPVYLQPVFQIPIHTEPQSPSVRARVTRPRKMLFPGGPSERRIRSPALRFWVASVTLTRGAQASLLQLANEALMFSLGI